MSDASRDPLVFNVNDNVLVENFYRQPKWLSGTVVQHSGPVSYKVNVDGVIMQWHLDQMRATDPAMALHRNVIQEPVAPNTEPQCVRVRNEQTLAVTDKALAPGEVESPIVGQHQYVTKLERKQCPTRQRHPPDRYGFGQQPNKGGGM